MSTTQVVLLIAPPSALAWGEMPQPDVARVHEAFLLKAMAPLIRMALSAAGIHACVAAAVASIGDGIGGPLLRRGHNVHDRQAAETYWNEFLQNRRDAMHDRRPVRVDYMGRHPFEQNDELHEQSTRQAQSRQRQNATVSSDLSLYEPFRVQFDTHLLDALTTSYPSHVVSYVRNVLLPAQANFWSETLSVVPAQKIEVPLSGTRALCAQRVKELSGFDLNDFLELDPSQGAGSTVSNIGSDANVFLNSADGQLEYNDKDLVILVLPVEGTALCPEMLKINETAESFSQQGQLAFASNCQHDQLDRPTVGYMGICFGAIDPADRSAKTHSARLKTIAHEVTHVMGMNSNDWPYFYSRVTGKPRTPRDAFNQPPMEEATCVDGTTQLVRVASADTIRPVTTENGYAAYEVVTETVRNVVRNQFDCQELGGARLENQPTAANDCFGSHWEQRLFNNEYMASYDNGSTQYVTALTLALLEDSGWYLPNYDVAQNSPFGLGAGCEFVEEPCLRSGGEVPEWGESTFCSSASSIGCTPDKELVAYCDISMWDSNLPAGYQYFDDPSVGGGLQQADFCPTFLVMFRFEVGDGSVNVFDCTDPNLAGTWVQRKGESFGPSSRCIEQGSGGDRSLCLEVACEEDGSNAGKVQILESGNAPVFCSYKGEVLRLPSGTEVICPSFAETCPESVCPANCAGRGECDFSLSPPQCECFDKSDTSPFCASSPHSFAPTTSPAPTYIATSSASSANPTRRPTIAPTARVQHTSTCTNSPGYKDMYGDSCAYYEANPSLLCVNYGTHQAAGDAGMTPNDHCCVCKELLPPTPMETPSHHPSFEPSRSRTNTPTRDPSTSPTAIPTAKSIPPTPPQTSHDGAGPSQTNEDKTDKSPPKQPSSGAIFPRKIFILVVVCALLGASLL